MNTLKRLLPHIEIILGGMLLVLCVIDRFNSAMAFIDNDITKTLIMLLCVLSLTNAVILLKIQRSRERRKTVYAERSQR